MLVTVLFLINFISSIVGYFLIAPSLLINIGPFLSKIVGILDQRSRRTPSERYTDQSSSSVEKSERFIQVKASQVPTPHTPGPHTNTKHTLLCLLAGAGCGRVIRSSRRAAGNSNRHRQN